VVERLSKKHDDEHVGTCRSHVDAIACAVARLVLRFRDLRVYINEAFQRL
jgi:hypothetical protein